MWQKLFKLHKKGKKIIMIIAFQNASIVMVLFLKRTIITTTTKIIIIMIQRLVQLKELKYPFWNTIWNLLSRKLINQNSTFYQLIAIVRNLSYHLSTLKTTKEKEKKKRKEGEHWYMQGLKKTTTKIRWSKKKMDA